MSLKLAFGGKGGVGKTTLSALVARLLAKEGKRVIAIDADPVSNLPSGLGIGDEAEITPIAQLSDLIAERTGATPGTMGGFFTLNPKVDDIPDRFSLEKDGVKLLVMGTVQKGGSGCICPESTILKALMLHLVLQRDEVVLMDMEAGVEHLGRATTSAVNALVTVVNPGSRSRVAALQIRKLAEELGIGRVLVIGNRVQSDEDRRMIEEGLKDFEIIGFVPELPEVASSDRQGKRPYEDLENVPKELLDIAKTLADLER